MSNVFVQTAKLERSQFLRVGSFAIQCRCFGNSLCIVQEC